MILAMRFARFPARFLPIGDRRRWSDLLFHSLAALLAVPGGSWKEKKRRGRMRVACAVSVSLANASGDKIFETRVDSGSRASAPPSFSRYRSPAIPSTLVPSDLYIRSLFSPSSPAIGVFARQERRITFGSDFTQRD